MSSVAHYYRKASFRPGAEYLIGDTRVVFSYCDTVSFDIDCNKAASEEIARLCQGLEDGLVLPSGLSLFGDFEPYANEILLALDRFGLLTEAAPSDPGYIISGAAFWTEVSAFTQRAKVKAGPVLYEALRSKHTTRSTLIRYAKEYYHIVRAGPAIIAGSIAHSCDRQTRRMLEDFLASEMGHDQLISSAIASVGVKEDELQSSLPLPETFAIISALQVFADQEPLTFKALAFLMEETSPEFNKSFVSACEYEGLGHSFWQPIIDHGRINDESAHGSISRSLLARVEFVSVEERVVVLKQAITMIENVVALEHALLMET
jgi:hypothetical protein